MLLLLILFLVILFLGLALLAVRGFNESETADVIRESVCLAAGVHKKG